MMKHRACELCNQQAYLYCPSDSAFLCWNCDARVHEANFIVARHIRHLLCSECNGFSGNPISGTGISPLKQICRFCSSGVSSDEADSLSSSSSSACVSSTESCATAPKKINGFKDRCKAEKIGCSSSVTEVSGENSWIEQKKKKKKKKNNEEPRPIELGSHGSTSVDAKVEEVFVKWSRKLGLKGNSIALSAARAMGKMKAVLPFRVALATSFWFGLRFCGDTSLTTRQNLILLEEISGVPAKLILAAEAKLARLVRRKRAARRDQEGWAECPFEPIK